MAQLVQHLPRTQNIVGSSPARGSSSFSLEKKELYSGVVACICLVSINDHTCTCALQPPPLLPCPSPQLLLGGRAAHACRQRRVQVRLRVPGEHRPAGHHPPHRQMLPHPHGGPTPEIWRGPCWSRWHRENRDY